MPVGCDINFTTWWRSLESSAKIKVRYPHERHKNAGRVSNSAKTSLMDDFLLFVDINSQPNGRSAGSHGPTRYFLSKFNSIQSPKKNVSNYQERLERSVVGEFCRAQVAMGKNSCSNGSASNWLRKHRPKVATSPRQKDYRDTCAGYNVRIQSKQTTLNHIRQTGSSSALEQQQLQEEMKTLRDSLEDHRKKAQRSHEDYISLTERCKKEMEKINTLDEKTDRSREEEDELVRLKKFVSQMSKLIPSWGYSPQPGSTYYLQKLSHDILGIVNHSDNSSAIYIFDEHAAPKNTDHTISYITDYLCKSGIMDEKTSHLS